MTGTFGVFDPGKLALTPVDHFIPPPPKMFHSIAPAEGFHFLQLPPHEFYVRELTHNSLINRILKVISSKMIQFILIQRWINPELSWTPKI